MKVMISQPMLGRSNEEIKKEREELVNELTKVGYEVVNTIFDLGEDATPLNYLSKSIDTMSDVDVVIFMPGWENARGCRIEFEVATKYGKLVKCL